MSRKLMLILVVIAVLAGLALRLYPLALGAEAVARVYITEDGYLMLTVARNLALGLGLSVSDGTIATNGVQPLATFLYAIPYLLTGGDKTLGLQGVLVISAALSVAGLWAMRAFAARVLAPQGVHRLWPWLLAALWFTGPLLLRHTMNALETGLYTLCVLLVVLWFHRVLQFGNAVLLGERLLLGALCGVAFLARNDAVFLCAGVFGMWFLHGLLALRVDLLTAFHRVVAPVLMSLAVALPWLVYNKLGFGSIVPISGAAQKLGAEFGQNAGLLPGKVFEHLFPMLPLPGGVEAQWPVVALCAVLSVAVLGAFALRMIRRGGPMAYALAAYALYGVALGVYYGLFFGAPHFMSRYLAPMAPLLIVASGSVLLEVLRALMPRRGGAAFAWVTTAAIALALALNLRPLMAGAPQGHFQVVDWVRQNVPEEAWIGAVQTGTLGYWHDRTINLDGKVNPDALAVLRREGDVLGYVAASKIGYVADWAGIADWVERGDAAFAEAFELVVHDGAANLAVLRRRAAES